ncbi:SsrA-binding protein SmpB [Candidatus Saccharibacteria bacterium]|nr:SsrA-binding protein SmpB [Candidatus Saccharibacteria bacterium]
MKKPVTKPPIVNRRARFDYELGETISAGIILSGPEVRGARLGHVRLTGSYANIKAGELWLTNMSITIPDTAQAHTEEREITTPRKLLVTKKQLLQIEDAKKQGMTIVPTRLFTTGKFIKIELAIAKGKKNYDKRETIKRRQQDRDAGREIKR